MAERDKRIYLSPPHMGGHERRFISEVFDSNWIAPLGPCVDAFEKDIIEYTGAAAAVALSSGTAAVHLGLKLLDVAPEDTVFCSTLTFVGSVNPVLYEGARPVFIDSEPASWNMSPQALRTAFRAHAERGIRPGAVIIVNLYGQSADMTPLSAICEEYGVPIIEDAAESLGATYGAKASGTLGKFGIYSFNGNKIITTSGGGMLVSDDVTAVEKARFLATQARDAKRYYEHSEPGYNYRMSNILAAVGRGQMKALDERINARRRIFSRYYEVLSGIDGIGFMPEPAYGRSTRWLTVITIDQKRCGVTVDALIDAMEEENIEARNVWKPMHRQPLFSGSDYFSHDEEKSISDALFRSGLCLPSGSGMTEADMERVLRCIKKTLRRGI